MKCLERLSCGLTRLTAYGAEVCLFCLVILVGFSATSRYLFARPIHIMEELGGLLFLALGLLSFAVTFRSGNHVRITMITSRLPTRVRKWIDLFSSIISILYLAIFTKFACDFVYLSYQADCHTANVRIYAVPWMAILPLSCITLAMLICDSCILRYRGTTRSDD